jgi:hypothetical protein
VIRERKMEQITRHTDRQAAKKYFGQQKNMVCNLRNAVYETEERFRGEMKERGIIFSADVVNLENDAVLCNLSHIRQIEENLLNSALKHTEAGGRIWYQLLQSGRDDHGFAYFDIQVKCSGAGVLGSELAEARKLVSRHGGAMEIYSESGVGSVLIARLKCEIVSKEEELSA